jgi:hypothetical protein
LFPTVTSRAFLPPAQGESRATGRAGQTWISALALFNRIYLQINPNLLIDAFKRESKVRAELGR